MPPPASLRLVVDTNVWVSYLLTKSFTGLNVLIASSRFRLLYSQEQMDELANVLDRPRIAKQISDGNMAALFAVIHDHGHSIALRSEVHVCRDPDDDKTLALCKDGRANLLITGDKDLLVLRRFGTTRILSPAQFLAEYK